MGMMDIFRDDKFFISPSFPSKNARNLTKLIGDHGGRICNSFDQECIYVIEKFEGDEFARLKEKDNVIVLSANYIGELIAQGFPSPQIMQQPLPLFLMSRCLEGAIICCTGIENRDELKFKACAMGANFAGPFRKICTHLLSTTVRSPKYLAAHDAKCPVLDPKWLQACWESCSKVDVEQYKLPVFCGITLSVTGVRGAEKYSIVQLVEKNGGKCTEDLRPEYSILVATAPEGRKYDAAISWGITVVSPEWVHKSVQLGFSQDTAKFKVEKSGQLLLGDSKTDTENLPSHIPATPNSSLSSASFSSHNSSLGSYNGSDYETSKPQNVKQTNQDSIPTKPKQNPPNQIHNQQSQSNIPNQRGLVRSGSSDAEIESSCQVPDAKKKRGIDMSANFNTNKRVKNEQESDDISYSPFRGEAVFNGLLFMCVGFDQSQFTNLCVFVEKFGGKCITSNNIQTPNSPTLSGVNYIILEEKQVMPQLPANSRVPPPPYVTINWLEACVAQERIVELAHPLHMPLKASTPFPEMRAVWATLSGFREPEREYHRKLLRLLGAKFTDTFCKKITHLICSEPSGEKFATAQKWGTAFILSLDWLYECAKSGRRVNEDKYLFHPLSELQLKDITQRLLLKRKQTVSSTQQASQDIRGTFNQALTTVPQQNQNRIPNPPKPLLTPQPDNQQKFNKPDPPPIIKPERQDEDISRSSKNLTNMMRNEPSNTNNTKNSRTSKQGPNSTANGEPLPEDQQILCGFTIAVAAEDPQLVASCHDMVKQLGGNFEWSIEGPSVTHCLYEVKKAKIDKKILDMYEKALSFPQIEIVSPAWLKACFDSKSLASTSAYPPTMNPRKSLGVEKEHAPRPSTNPPLVSPKLALAPRKRTLNEFPEETNHDVSTPLRTSRRPLSPPSSILSLTPIPHNSSSYASTPTPSRTPTRPSSPYRSTPYVRPASPPHDESSRIDESLTSPILRAADADPAKDQSGYDAEVSTNSKSADEVSRMEVDNEHPRQEVSDGLIDQFKVLTERINLLQHEGAKTNHTFLPPPTSSPPKKLKKTKSSKFSRALLESDDSSMHGKGDKDTPDPQRDSATLPHLHYSQSSLDDDGSSACSQVVTYDDTSVSAKLSLLELAASKKTNETTDTKNMLKELSGLFKTNDIKSPIKGKTKQQKEEPEKERYNLPPPTKQHTFTLTGCTAEDKIKYGKIIQALGGAQSSYVQPLVTTHVIAEKPAQSEKFMAGCAAGVWVVHPTYLLACEREKKWVAETPYEWVQENFSAETVEDRAKNWLNTPGKCRLEVEKQRRESSDISNTGMFKGMHLLLLTDTGSPELVRVVEAGGAKVTQFGSINEITASQIQSLGITHSFSKRFTSQNQAFCTAMAKLGLTHLVLPDLEKILFSGRAGPPSVTYNPAQPQQQPQQRPQQLQNDDKAKQPLKPQTTNTTTTSSKVESPPNPRKTSPPKKGNVSPTKPQPKSPTRVIKPKDRSVSPPPPKARKVESTPMRTRAAKDTSPQRATKLKSGVSVFDFDDEDDSKTKKRTTTRKTK